MTKNEACPVCGAVNTRTYHTDCVGLVEDYYNCGCGYFSHMAYSPVYKGICVPEGKTEEEITQKYGKKIAELNLAFVPSEQMP